MWRPPPWGSPTCKGFKTPSGRFVGDRVCGSQDSMVGSRATLGEPYNIRPDLLLHAEGAQTHSNLISTYARVLWQIQNDSIWPQRRCAALLQSFRSRR